MIKNFFKTNPYKFEPTDRYKNCNYDNYANMVNELVYTFGRVYLFLGISDEFDDAYYIFADSNGLISYHSMVGDIGEPLKDYMKKSSYKVFKKYFLDHQKYQRDWRKSFDSGIYLDTPNKYTHIDYELTDKGVPVIRKRYTNLDKYECDNSFVLDNKNIRHKFWMSFWHIFGFHYIVNVRTIYDEVQYERESIEEIPNWSNIDEISIGRCKLCEKIVKVKPRSKFVDYCHNHEWCYKLFKPIYKFCYYYRREIKD